MMLRATATAVRAPAAAGVSRARSVAVRAAAGQINPSIKKTEEKVRARSPLVLLIPPRSQLSPARPGESTGQSSAILNPSLRGSSAE